MYTFLLIVNYIIAFLIIFYIIKNIFIALNVERILPKVGMSALYVLAIIIIFDASKFAHMACLYPNEYAAAGLSSVEIIIRDIVAIVLVIVANYIKVSLDKSVEEKIKENQKDQQTKKWKKFLNG